MDTTVLPGDDFFAYANGAWLKKTIIPSDQVRWGPLFQSLDDTQQKSRTILEQVVKDGATGGHIEQLIGDFYASGMDTITINQLDYQPLKAELMAISAINHYTQLVPHLVTDESFTNIAWNSISSPLIGYYTGPDDRQSSITRLNFKQAGLSLPEKGYYIRADEASQSLRVAFVAYIANLFSLTGMKPATARAKAEAILAFETRLAQSHKDPAQLRNPATNYTKLAVAELNRRMPHLNWPAVLTSMSLPTVDTVLMAQPDYYQALDAILPTTPIELLKDKLLFDLLDHNAPLLSTQFEQASFEFNNKLLYGQPLLADRWKRLVSRTDEELGDALGQLWVRRYFPPDARERVLTLIENLQTVYRERIRRLDWMSPQTKAIALTKLGKIIKKIGYPDQWKDYAGLIIKRNDYYGNVQRTRQYRIQRALRTVNQPADRTEWLMTPPTVNAYANPSTNEIAFPAGFLQFPLFDKDADDAINYGAVGTIIGHELTHLFDDEGRQYDAAGNLRNWWTKQDEKLFEQKAERLIKQYNEYRVLDTLHVNGRLTVGENLADLGGLTLAYEAFKQTSQGRSGEKIDGFTPDQRFFLGMAQVFRVKIRDESQRARLLTDPHSPPQFRINGTISNFEPFYEAFGVKPGQKLYKPKFYQTRVW